MQTELKATGITVRNWRMQHGGRMTGLPVDLQCRVVKLLEKHSWHEVCDAVGISKSQLSSWRCEHREHLQLQPRPRRSPAQHTRPRERSSSRRATLQPAASFIELSVPTETACPDIEVKLPTGVIVRARNSANITAVAELVGRLVAAASA